MDMNIGFIYLLHTRNSSQYQGYTLLQGKGLEKDIFENGSIKQDDVFTLILKNRVQIKNHQKR